MARRAGADPEIDRLYASLPDEFVQARDDLARSLRAEGKREAAGEVKKLRRPTVAAWVVNQLARREKMRLRGLFTAGERLRAAHAELLGDGSAEALERARDDERDALEELAGAARALLEEAGHPPTDAVLTRVRGTLHAAVVDEQLGERVREGRLAKEEQASGFGFTSPPGTVGESPQSAPARRERTPKAVRDGAAVREQRRRAAERLRAARKALGEAERAVQGKRRELERAERELEKRRAAVEKAEDDADQNRMPPR